MIDVPINCITWSLGSLALYTLALKSWLSYKRTRNPLARMYYALGLTFGTALFFFGVPGLFTENLHVIRVAYFLADLFAQVSMQVQIWMLWFLGLRNRVSLGHVYLVSLPFSAVLVTLQAMSSHVGLSQSPHLIMYIDKPVVLALKSIIYVGVAVPIGYFLIRQVPSQTSLRAKLKTFMSGMTFIGVALAATSNNIFDKGSDTQQSATIVAGLFVVFLLVQLLRPTARPDS